MTGVPPAVVVAVVLALAIFASAFGLLWYADVVERCEALRQAALANARRDAQRRDFDTHVDEALAVADPVDWARREQEMHR